MGKNTVMKSAIILLVVLFWALNNVRYYEVESLNESYDSSLIGLTINGSVTTNFPAKESGLAIDSIICDKGTIGVWDYSNWMLRLKNVSQNRTKCQVNFVSKYTENILNGTDPVLKEGLIPVEISDNGIVTRAKLKDSWYSYENQKWANAVILTNESKEYYEGEEISESDIESYFVWIPRYKYQIFNDGNYSKFTSIMNNVQTINVVFETKDVTPSTGSSVGSWLTHPAFTSFDVNGIWVGKFETGYKGATDTASAQVNVNDSSKIQIKPNVYSWRGIQVANAYLSSFYYNRDMNSHMMKNTEWGAVAYLQHSEYGSQASVRINNNEAYLTGYAGVVEPTCGYTGTNEDCNRYELTNSEEDGSSTVNYLNPQSVVASTTGNYSGIYDMSGGAWEYVMAVMLDSTNTKPCTGRDAINNSGFNGSYCNVGETESLTKGIANFPNDTRYYDVYEYATVDERYDRRILGDATGEMGPFSSMTYLNDQVRQLSSWYADEAWFAFSGYPWFCRGSGFLYGLGAGVFNFLHGSGSTGSYVSFRVVLSV